MSKDRKTHFTKATNKKLTKMRESSIWNQIKNKIMDVALDTDKLSYRFSQVNVPTATEAKYARSFSPE